MTQERVQKDVLRIDPDPFVIAGTYLVAASVVLQLVQIFQTWKGQRQVKRGESSGRTQLEHLETEVESLQSSLRRIERSIDRGAADSERGFYDARFRLHVSVLELASAEHQALSRDLASALQKTGAVATWVDSIVRRDPELASRMGGRLFSELPNATDAINAVLEKGKPNRELILEAKRTLEKLAEIVGDELSSGGRNA